MVSLIEGTSANKDQHDQTLNLFMFFGHITQIIWTNKMEMEPILPIMMHDGNGIHDKEGEKILGSQIAP